MTDTELPVELQEAFRVLSSAKNPAGDGPDPESLGSVYEQLRAGTLARRQAGAHYTPSILTGPIVAATLAPLVDGLSAGEVLELRIVDPAMGAGAFLAEACRYLADVYVDRCGDVDPVRARRRVAEHCIHGVDVDPIAVTLARRVLWLVVGDPSLELDFVDHALRCGDALVGEGRQPEESRVYPSEPFHWHEAFPKVFHRGGFHAVVGNPPFRNSVENRMAPSASHKRWWRARWPRFSAGSADQSRLFWARTLHDLLGPGGRYGMISPTALLSDAGEWQAWMFEYWRPDHLWLQPVDQFPGARIRTTTIIGGQGVCASVRVQDRERDPERPSRLVVGIP